MPHASLRRDPHSGRLLHRAGRRWLPLDEAIEALDALRDDRVRAAELERERRAWLPVQPASAASALPSAEPGAEPSAEPSARSSARPVVESARGPGQEPAPAS